MDSNTSLTEHDVNCVNYVHFQSKIDVKAVYYLGHGYFVIDKSLPQCVLAFSVTST